MYTIAAYQPTLDFIESNESNNNVRFSLPERNAENSSRVFPATHERVKKFDWSEFSLASLLKKKCQVWGA